MLPDRYATLTDIAIPFVALLAVGQALFAYNLLRTLGKPYFGSLSVPGRWRARSDFGAIVAAPAPAFGIWAAFTAPMAFGPLAVVLSLGGYRLGARWAGLLGLVIAVAGMAIGLLFL